MAVPVAGPGAHQRHPRCDRVEQRLLLLSGAVVGDLENVGAQLGGAGGEQVALLIDLRVARQQDPDPGHVGPQDE
ncbi:hypothetical protein GCM10009681_31070 [Luedemannella helvata]|uniref:Uncharacterized protein n=1 Tax=Luedemannella helvata TaxID=349315 RepID=A0ABN2KJ87_9ACTN